MTLLYTHSLHQFLIGSANERIPNKALEKVIGIRHLQEWDRVSDPFAAILNLEALVRTRISDTNEGARAKKARLQKERLIGGFITLLGLVFFVGMVLTESPESENYHKVHNSLLVASAMVIGVCMVLMKFNESFLASIRRLLVNKDPIDAEDRINLLWIANFLLAAIGFLIVDVPSVMEKGVQIGAIGAVTLTRIAWGLIKRK